jgi:lipopolysaccharide transport system permease protein
VLTGHWQALWVFPFLVALQWLLSYLCAHVLAILTAASRDTTQALGFALSIGIYLSPVLFPLNLFPSEWQWLLYINPMTSLVLSYQSVLLIGKVPDISLWCILLGWIALMTFILWGIIVRSREELVDWL